jgi:hypothetical protein
MDNIALMGKPRRKYKYLIGKSNEQRALPNTI